jgi:hypothetical protein
VLLGAAALDHYALGVETACGIAQLVARAPKALFLFWAQDGTARRFRKLDRGGPSRLMATPMLPPVGRSCLVNALLASVG